MTITEVNKIARNVKLFIDGLYTKFVLPVYVSDDTCRLIAYAKLSKGKGDAEVWLNGEKVKVKDLALQVSMVSQKGVTKSSSVKQKTQESE